MIYVPAHRVTLVHLPLKFCVNVCECKWMSLKQVCLCGDVKLPEEEEHSNMRGGDDEEELIAVRFVYAD